MNMWNAKTVPLEAQYPISAASEALITEADGWAPRRGQMDVVRLTVSKLGVLGRNLAEFTSAKRRRLGALDRSVVTALGSKISAFADRLMDFVAREVVTVAVEDTDLRFMVVKRDRVRSWGSVPLEPGTVRDGMVLNAQALGGLIRELITSGRLKKGTVVASLSGFQSVHRIVELPRMSKRLLGEAVLSEAKRTMPVSLDELYLSWEIVGEERGVQRLLLLGTPRNLVDAEFRCLGKARLRPRSMDIKPIALARMVNQPDALIIDMEPESCEIIVMAGGVPAIMRSIRIHPDSGPMDWTQHILEEFERTLRFYESNYPNAALSQDTPLFLTGKLAGEKELSQAVAAGAGFNVQPLARRLKCPPDLPISQYACNIGLALRESAANRAAQQGTLSATDLDVLPQPYRLRRLSARQGLVASGILMGVALAVPIYQVADTATVEARRLGLEYSVLEQSSVFRRAKIKEARQFEQAIASAEAQKNSLLKILQDYQEMADRRQRAYDSLRVPITLAPDGALPVGARLYSISQGGSKLALRGTAQTYEIALQYADALRRIDGFSNVQVHSLGKSDKDADTVNFDIGLTWK